MNRYISILQWLLLAVALLIGSCALGLSLRITQDMKTLDKNPEERASYSDAAPMTTHPEADTFRILLSWLDEPKNLDAHLNGRDANGNEIHVYFADKQHVVNGELYALLDHEDANGNGYETITILGLPAETLTFSVHDYSNQDAVNSMALSASGARVRVMQGGDTTKTVYQVDVKRNTDAVVWDVFQLTPEGIIFPLNTYGSGPVDHVSVGVDYR